MDLSIFQLMLMSDEFVDISNELEKFSKHECCFYYDESNNIRKLWLNENDFNAPIDRDFVLGGVMHFGQFPEDSIENLKEKLRLQKTAKELKFKHISQGKDFLECLAEPKVMVFLKWLAQNDLYIHCASVNNLYYAIVDIIDTIDEPAYIPFNKEMKNELYCIAQANYFDFYKLLATNNYPNIAADKIASFYQGILDFIDNGSGDVSFELELLRQGLKSAKKQTELTFLQGNTEKTIIDNYFMFYLRPIGVFANAQHIFDNEYCIAEEFAKHDLHYGDNKAGNFCFVDSKDNLLVQVSDCVIGLFGKYYTYINSINLGEAHEMLNTISSTQKEALSLFAQMIYKSEMFSKLLLNSVESLEEHQVGAFILNNAI